MYPFIICSKVRYLNVIHILMSVICTKITLEHSLQLEYWINESDTSN